MSDKSLDITCGLSNVLEITCYLGDPETGYLTDEDGNYVTDEDGNPIKIF